MICNCCWEQSKLVYWGAAIKHIGLDWSGELVLGCFCSSVVCCNSFKEWLFLIVVGCGWRVGAIVGVSGRVRVIFPLSQRRVGLSWGRGESGAGGYIPTIQELGEWGF